MFLVDIQLVIYFTSIFQLHFFQTFFYYQFYKYLAALWAVCLTENLDAVEVVSIFEEGKDIGKGR